MTRVGVVGGGITGLTLTHELAKRGIDVRTYEASPEPGGVIRSDRVSGHLLEYGPQRVRLADPLARLVDELSLKDELIRADDDLPLYVYWNGALRAVPRGPLEFLRSDLLSWPGKLRVLSEPLRAGIDPDETAAAAFRRKFGDEAYHRVIAPLFGGIYGSDPAEMPARYALKTAMAVEGRSRSLLVAGLRRLLGGDPIPPAVTFRDGLQTLPKTLYAHHEERVSLNEAVTDVEIVDEERVALDTEGRAATVDTVVITASAPATSSLLESVDPDSAGHLADLRYNPLVLVHLHSNADVRGFGYQVAHGEDLETLGVTFNDSLFDHTGVYSVYLGGMHDPSAIDRSAESLGETARTEFQRVVGTDTEVIDVTKYPNAFPAYDQSWTALERVDLPDNIHLATNFDGGLGVAKRIREASRLAESLAVPD